MRKLFTLIGWLVVQMGMGQTRSTSFSFQYDASTPVKVNTRNLINPWAGGLNGTQYSTLHLDADPVLDLVVYDRQTNRVMTFLARKGDNGSYRWQYAPQYEERFPKLVPGSWMLLADYDHDGRKDLFTHTNGGLRILQNTSTNGVLSWKTIADPVYHEGLSSNTNLYITSVDVPAIVDLDDDGDLDFLAYDITGSTCNLFQNMSVERKGDPNGLDFKRIGYCWGGFASGTDCDKFLFGFNCTYTEGKGGETSQPGARVMHNGNSLLIMDANGDGRKDVLTAHVTCTNVSFLPNTGANNSAAVFRSFQNQFPASRPISFNLFPALFTEDLDFDGQKDLVASPNTYGTEGNLIDLRACNWLYHNAGTSQKPDFRYVSSSFLQEDMIDLGENAAPALADLDGDGDQDLLVGHVGERSSTGFWSGLAYFENVGTRLKPSFELRTTNYLQLFEQFRLTNLKPSFADLDGNGSLDLVFTGLSVTKAPEIRYVLNTGAKGKAFQLDPSSIQLLATPGRLGFADRVTWYDVDQDGKTDLLIGKQSGVVEYHRNTGSATSPKYALQDQNFGQIKEGAGATGPSIVVIDLNGDNHPELLLGTGDGLLKLYQMPEEPGQPLELISASLILNDLTQAADGATPGGNLVLTAADLTGDGLPEVLAGTTGGGIRFLRNTSEKALVTAQEEDVMQPWVYPNPTERFLRIDPPANGLVEVLNQSGQRVTPGLVVKARTLSMLDLGVLTTGTYFVRFTQPNQTMRTRKIILNR